MNLSSFENNSKSPSQEGDFKSSLDDGIIPLTKIKWSESHGVTDNTNGAVDVYRYLLSIFQPKTALVIGSGAGFIPYVILSSSTSHVFLVDAFIGETGNGSPMEVSSKIEHAYDVLSNYKNRFTFIASLSEDFFRALPEYIKFDLIFIDGDHSYEGASSDLNFAKQKVSDDGIIFFHDARMPSVQKAAREVFGDWLKIPAGEGTGVFIPHGNLCKIEKDVDIMKFIDVVTISSAAAKSQRSENKWKYLSKNVFEKRYYAVTDYLMRSLDITGGLVIEIGGNPSPYNFFLKERIPSIRTINVEPAIADVSKHKFQELLSNGGMIFPHIRDVDADSVKLSIFFGIDFSLSKDYEDFVETIQNFIQIINKSDYVLLESAAFIASRTLHNKILTFCDVLFSENLKIDSDVGEFSINDDILNRHVTLCKVKTTPCFDQEFLSRLASIYGLPGTPSFSTFLGNGFHDAEQVAFSLGLNLERTNNGSAFCWLSEHFYVSVPPTTKFITLHFHPEVNGVFFQQPNLLGTYKDDFGVLTIERGMIEYRFEVADKFLDPNENTIRWNLTLPIFIPRQENANSTDNRKLSVSINAITVSS